MLGAFDDRNSLIGVVGFYREPRSKIAHKGNVWGMYVTPENRDKGVGRALLLALIERVKGLGDIRQVNLGVATTSAAAIHLYESNGFAIFGTERDVVNVGGRYFDEHHMQLVLDVET